MTLPMFVVSSGRSGTETFYRLLKEYSEVRSHHEYQVHQIQPLSCKHAMNLIDNNVIRYELDKIYTPAIRYETKRVWANSCNKASWFIPFLYELFPTAKFIHLVRDGRRCVSSFYNKLSRECYPNEEVEMFKEWLAGKRIEPPYEKRYWWPLFEGRNQFEHICWYWRKVNETIVSALANIPPSQYHIVKLEDFTTDFDTFSKFFQFLGLVINSDLFETLKRPTNVREPISYALTDEQKIAFWEICGGMMGMLKYTDADYEVQYQKEENRTKGEVRYSY